MFRLFATAFALGLCAVQAFAQGIITWDRTWERWKLPAAADVRLGGDWGAAYGRGVARLAEPPYKSVPFLRADVSLEMKRVYINYSGDISGRFIEIASLTSPKGKMQPEALEELLRTIAQHQKPDGHFGADLDWSTPLHPKEAVRTPILWGHGRLLVGLLQAAETFNRPDLLDTAKKLGDFYLATADRLLDPAREAEYRGTGTYASGYVTDYFPAIEGLVRLYQATNDQRYLKQAERMAEFFERFDKLPLAHSHGNLIAYHGLALLYEATAKPAYLDRIVRRWEEAMDGGYIWHTGGVGEAFNVSCGTDEGCSEADWLRLNLDLWRLTGKSRYLATAERLLMNHYAMNRTANGGYGHHQFSCDKLGPVAMRPKFVEATWCCTFHGLLGLHTLKQYVVVGAPDAVYVNFPFDVDAPVTVGNNTVQVRVTRADDFASHVTCRLTVEPSAAGATAPAVYFRQPDWARFPTVTDSQGREFLLTDEDGYLRLKPQAGEPAKWKLTFKFAPRVEDRRRKPLKFDDSQIARTAGVALWNGPWLLLSGGEKRRPVVVAEVTGDGGLRLPKSVDGVYQLPTVDALDSPEPAVRKVLKDGPTVPAARWGKVDASQGASLVFDLITVPVDDK